MVLCIEKRQMISISFIITYFLYALTDAVYVSKGIDNVAVSMKYIFALAVIASGVYFVLRYNLPLRNLYILRNVTCAAIMLTFISMVRMLMVDEFSLAFIQYFFKMELAALLAVVVLDALDRDSILCCMKWILFLSFFCYLVWDVGMNNFTIANIQAISFSKSYSPFESHYACGSAFALCLFFSFYRERKFCWIVSLIFVLMTFKRLFVVFGIIAAILPIFIDTKQHIRKRLSITVALALFACTCLYYLFLIPENQHLLLNILNVDSMDELTSTRSLFFEQLYTGHFTNFGLGSCEAYLGRIIEMDFIQLLIETTPVGLAAVIFFYWGISRSNLYSMICMAFMFLNMIASHSILGNFMWTLVFITIGLVNADISKNISESETDEVEINWRE